MQSGYVKPQMFTPVVEAIPFESAQHLLKFCVQPRSRLFWMDAVHFRILLRYMMQPHVIVEGEIQDRAVHVKHQGFAIIQSDFGIEFHCFILRAPRLVWKQA